MSAYKGSSAISGAFLGDMLNRLTNGRLFTQLEQRPDFALPARFSQASKGFEEKDTAEARERDEQGGTAVSTPVRSQQQSRDEDVEATGGVLPDGDALHHSDTQVSILRNVKAPPGTKLVDWYDANDAENPQNWPRSKKLFLTLLISFLTFSAYSASSTYTPSIEGVMQEFGVSQTKAIVGLSAFVFGYSVGPMFLSPPSEIPSVGRNGMYIPTLVLFLASNILAAFAPNYSTLMAGRFLAGFFGSPALATGGASIADVWDQKQTSKYIALWSAGAVAGPALGPVLASYAVQNVGWRWSLYVICMISGLGLVILTIALPETYAPTILHRRAVRLRKLTGDESIRSQGEIDQSGMSAGNLIREALWRPIRLCAEPVVLGTSLYLGIAYACFYLWFEAFPIVFSQNHSFGIGASSLPFLGLVVAVAITVVLYVLYLEKVYDPRAEAKAKQGVVCPEDRLEIALIAAPLLPISLFWFGWTSSASISYWSPIVAASCLLPGLFLLFQSILTYLPMSYFTVAASVLAANDLIRSIIAGAFPLFGQAFYEALGVGPACSLLGGVTAFMILPLYLLKRYGHVLRRHSKYAHNYD